MHYIDRTKSDKNAIKLDGRTMNNPQCPYCGHESTLVTGKEIYPRLQHLHKLFFYQCITDDAYVGCHKNTSIPLGRLANAELRKYKSKAHATFDPIWKSNELTRADAYKWLAYKMEIDSNNCHIGMFSIDQCKSVIRIMKEHYQNAE